MTLKNVPTDFQPDQIFDTQERLYRRLAPQYIYEGNRVRGTAVDDIEERNPSCCFNRSKYSDPDCVLNQLHPEQNRIAFLVVSNMPAPVPHPEEKQVFFGFRIEHRPARENYSLTEVLVTKHGNPVKKLRNEVLRRDLREALADKMSVLDP